MNATTLPDPAGLLMPLLVDGPCGADLRYDQIYDKIPELARSESDDLPKGVWERESKKSDWPAVAALCIEVLTTRTKDMQISAWLGESLTRLHGPKGAALGWTIFSRLTTIFWHNIHPRMDGEDAEFRLTSVYWFAKRTGYWLTEYLALSSKDGESLLSSGATQVEDLPSLKALLQELQQLQLFFNQQLGQQTPFFHQLTEQLQKQFDTFASLPKTTSADATALADAQTTTATSTQHSLHSRDAAYAALGDIARVLSKTEPHSPVPMILDALVSWRDDQFNDLLARMPQDKASLYELVKFFKKP